MSVEDNVPLDTPVVEGTEPPQQQQQQEKPVAPKDLRGQLEKNFEDDRKAVAEKDKAAAKTGKGKQYQSQARQLAAEEGTEGTEPPQQQEQPTVAAPEAFSKEAKAEWASVPPTVQAAILKREQDVAKGVEELKSKYSDIDKVLQPHDEAIRRHGHSRAQAVNQLFAWFQALAANPQVAFPALAKSFNYDLTGAPTLPAQTQQQQQPGGVQPPGEVPTAVQQYITSLEQRMGQFEKQYTEKLYGLESSFAQQSQAKTQEILDSWSRDKPHFQDVRQLMASLITSGAVPLNNGQVDLDGAYSMAIYANPEVRAKVMAEQEKARADELKKKQDLERLAQSKQAEAARKAGVSVGGGAPGAVGAGKPGKPGVKKSVRESLMEAREELSN